MAIAIVTELTAREIEARRAAASLGLISVVLKRGDQRHQKRTAAMPG